MTQHVLSSSGTGGLLKGDDVCTKHRSRSLQRTSAKATHKRGSGIFFKLIAHVIRTTAVSLTGQGLCVAAAPEPQAGRGGGGRSGAGEHGQGHRVGCGRGSHFGWLGGGGSEGEGRRGRASWPTARLLDGLELKGYSSRYTCRRAARRRLSGSRLQRLRLLLNLVY
jgi:hypothetical protein